MSARYVRREMLEYLREKLAPALNKVDLSDLSRHNTSYRHYGCTVEERFRNFVETEFAHFDRYFSWAVRNLSPGRRILEVGCFIPILPLGLQKLGFEVTVVEKASMYGPSFGAVRELCERNNIRFLDMDIVDRPSQMPTAPVISLINVVEHLNGSPRGLLQAIASKLELGGYLLFSVPNVASIGRRLALLRGRSPFPLYEDYWQSEYPFAGHNREYTLEEARYCVQKVGLVVQEECMLARAWVRGETLRSRILRFVEVLGPRTWRYMIFLVARKVED